MFLQLFQHFFCFFLHVGEAGSFRKPLKKEEEQACFEAMAAGDRSAREKLILHIMRLVAHIIKKYGMPQPEQEEKETGGLFRKKEDREDKSDDEGAGEHGAGKEA